MNSVLPTQASLDALLERVTRVKVVPPPLSYGQRNPLLDTSSESDIAALREALRIVEDPDAFYHCMCGGNPWLELYARRKLVATVSCHHGISIRWSAWTWDAVLADGMQLVNWLAERGVTSLRDEVARLQR